MLTSILFFAVGLVLLIKGGDWFVDGATGFVPHNIDRNGSKLRSQPFLHSGVLHMSPPSPSPPATSYAEGSELFKSYDLRLSQS